MSKTYNKSEHSTVARTTTGTIAIVYLRWGWGREWKRVGKTTNSKSTDAKKRNTKEKAAKGSA